MQGLQALLHGRQACAGYDVQPDCMRQPHIKPTTQQAVHITGGPDMSNADRAKDSIVLRQADVSFM